MKAYYLVLLLLLPYSVTGGDGDEQFRVKRQGFRLNLGSRSLLSGLSDVLGQFAKPKQNDKFSETATELPDYDYSEYRNDYEEETSDSTNKTLQDVVQQLIKVARGVYPIPSGRSALVNLNAHPSERFQFCRTPKNEPGHCRYIQHCLLPEFVTDFSKFVSYVCFINSRYVGACCPDDHPAENIPAALTTTTTTIPEVHPPIQDQQDKPFRPHRPERPNRRPGRPNRRPGKPFQPGRPNRPGRPFQPGRPNRPGRPFQPGRPNRPGRPFRPGRPNRPGRPFRPGRPNRPGRPFRPNGTERPYEPEEPEPTPEPTLPPTTTPKPTQPPPPPSPETSNSPYEEVCGLSFRTRIVGGKEADPGDWLWMAALIRGPADLTGQFCGGALINRYYVLTAAHCTEGFTANTIKVRLGEYDFSKTDDNSPTDVAVAEIKSHPNFDKVRYYNDIALLRLENPVTYSDFIRPICLPDPRNDLRSKVATVIGWGTLAYGGASSNVLQEVDIPVWDNEECNKTFVQKISKVFLCAGSKNGDKDSCQGDSGGPLMWEAPNRRWTLIGIVSWGIRCAEPNYPGVYTRVTEFLDWIRENISK
ncbi:uncharacterized protein LOC143224851 isoform X1 [Tachypleus tridentatus]|uniref:uncharacterized protein LOC143224851 isoform X1 n=1 Tax=Tachypleus tridentatus TaxID=6853 RepID=UPI003FD2D318